MIVIGGNRIIDILESNCQTKHIKKLYTGYVEFTIIYPRDS